MKKVILLCLLIAFSVFGQEEKSSSKNHSKAHHTRYGFKNPFKSFEERGTKDIFKWMIWDKLTEEDDRIPADSLNFEYVVPQIDALNQNDSLLSVSWVGHSTLFIQIDGLNILTDPIWSERASPVSFAGPKRYTKPAIELDALPDIDIVIISHDHYDHLDKPTLKKIGNKAFFLVPLGIGEILEDLDITRYQEFDWWEDISYNGVRFTCTPTQHFSGRTLFDKNTTLWASWVMEGKDKKVYFAGDTGYFRGFKDIAKRFGPMDIAAVPIGAYKPRWFMSPVHMDPIQAVDAFQDLEATYFVPIHWSTFNLADEPFKEPGKLLLKEVEKRNLNPDSFKVLKLGETFWFQQNAMPISSPTL